MIHQFYSVLWDLDKFFKMINRNIKTRWNQTLTTAFPSQKSWTLTCNWMWARLKKWVDRFLLLKNGKPSPRGSWVSTLGRVKFGWDLATSLPGSTAWSQCPSDGDFVISVSYLSKKTTLWIAENFCSTPEGLWDLPLWLPHCQLADPRHVQASHSHTIPGRI